MRKIILILIMQLAFFVCLFSFPIVYGSDGYISVLTHDGNIPFPYIPGDILVKWKSNASIHSIRQLKSGMGLKLAKTFHTIEVHRLRLPPSLQIEEALAKLRANPLVEYAEPNYIVRALATFPNDPPFDPGDPDYGTLWGLHNITSDSDIDAPEAWDITTGDNGVVIAVIDTGVAWKHPDLGGNIWTNPGEDPWSDPNDPTTGNGDDDDGNDKDDDWRGWDFLGDDNDPTDYSNHGTHVSGTIGALGNNATGITGVNWDASIMPLRFIGPFGYGDTAKAIEAILYAADNGAKVINASWGGGGFSQALYDAISYANDNGCLFVAAAGNSGNDNDTNPFYPASYDLSNIISVAATDQNDNRASFSNYGATSVDVGAPGVSIRSSVPLLSLGPENQILNEDFESGLGNWTHWGTNDSWDLTEPISVSPTHSLADSPLVNYLDDTDSYITYNTAYNLVDKRVSMDIQLRCDLEPFFDFLFIGGDLGGGYGFLPIYLFNGEGWFTDSTGGIFTQHTTDLSPLWDLSNGINIGFNLDSDSSITDDGVYIDDVTVVTQDLLITGYDYTQLQGTSMAAPHVSGLAGLILARYPSITLNELKDRILNGVDIVAGLNGMVLTNGRINAHKSLALPVGPTNLTATKVSSTQIDLNWSDNSDPEFNEDGFRIERRKGASGNYGEIDTVGQNTTTYSDFLSDGGTYYYRIGAYNGLGNSSYSNEANETVEGDPSPSPPPDGGGGLCFIATAAFGSPFERHVQVLRDLRDRYLLTNSIGKAFISLYYKFSPPIADSIAKNGALRAAARVGLYPAVGLRYIAPHFSHAGNITLLLGMLAIAAGMIYGVARYKKAALAKSIFSTRHGDYSSR